MAHHRSPDLLVAHETASERRRRTQEIGLATANLAGVTTWTLVLIAPALGAYLAETGAPLPFRRPS